MSEKKSAKLLKGTGNAIKTTIAIAEICKNQYNSLGKTAKNLQGFYQLPKVIVAGILDGVYEGLANKEVLIKISKDEIKAIENDMRAMMEGQTSFQYIIKKTRQEINEIDSLKSKKRANINIINDVADKSIDLTYSVIKKSDEPENNIINPQNENSSESEVFEKVSNAETLKNFSTKNKQILNFNLQNQLFIKQEEKKKNRLIRDKLLEQIKLIDPSNENLQKHFKEKYHQDGEIIVGQWIDKETKDNSRKDLENNKIKILPQNIRKKIDKDSIFNIAKKVIEIAEGNINDIDAFTASAENANNKIFKLSQIGGRFFKKQENSISIDSNNTPNFINIEEIGHIIQFYLDNIEDLYQGIKSDKYDFLLQVLLIIKASEDGYVAVEDIKELLARGKEQNINIEEENWLENIIETIEKFISAANNHTITLTESDDEEINLIKKILEKITSIKDNDQKIDYSIQHETYQREIIIKGDQSVSRADIYLKFVGCWRGPSQALARANLVAMLKRENAAKILKISATITNVIAIVPGVLLSYTYKIAKSIAQNITEFVLAIIMYGKKGDQRKLGSVGQTLLQITLTVTFIFNCLYKIALSIKNFVSFPLYGFIDKIFLQKNLPKIRGANKHEKMVARLKQITEVDFKKIENKYQQRYFDEKFENTTKTFSENIFQAFKYAFEQAKKDEINKNLNSDFVDILANSKDAGCILDVTLRRNMMASFDAEIVKVFIAIKASIEAVQAVIAYELYKLGEALADITMIAFGKEDREINSNFDRDINYNSQASFTNERLYSNREPNIVY